MYDPITGMQRLPLDLQSWPADLESTPASTRAEEIPFWLIMPRKEVSVRGEGKRRRGKLQEKGGHALPEGELLSYDGGGRR